MLNLNSVFSDGLKYNIKWHFPLTKMSMAQTQSELGCRGGKGCKGCRGLNYKLDSRGLNWVVGG